MGFAELGISTPVIEALSRNGVTEPFEVQAQAIPDALAGRDVLVRSRTGSGKTLVFALPIVERLRSDAPRPAAVILVPTRELASQVADEFRPIAKARGLRSAAVYGGVSIQVQAKDADQAHILIATPGRLDDLANRKMVDLSHVSAFVLDEADRMLDMGFMPQVQAIMRRLPKEGRQTMLFSATLDGAVGHLARYYTHDAVLHEIGEAQTTVEEADHRFIPVAPGDKVDKLLEILGQDRELTLVFVRTKHGADRLVNKLKRRGIQVAAMHGDMTQQARERAFAKFESEHVSVLVATDVAARGLDLDNISHVINYDPPQDDKGYLHRVGRTARAGRSGMGITFVQPQEEGEVGRMAARLQLGEEFKEEGMRVLPPQRVFASSGGGVFGRRRRR